MSSASQGGHQSSSRIMDILEVTQVFGMLAKTTFGPKGLYKSIVVMGESKQGSNNTIITKNGGVIFKSVVVTHPIGSIIVRMCKDLAETEGDGTLGAVMLCAELVRVGAMLVVEGCHPVVVHEGYLQAKTIIKETIEKLKIHHSETISLLSLCRNICFSVLASKLQPHIVPELTSLCMECFTRSDSTLDPAVEINIVPVPGGKTEVFNGVAIAQGPRDPSMPLSLSLPSFLLLSCPLPLPTSSTSLVFNTAGKHKELEDKIEESGKRQLEAIFASGATVVISTQQISGAMLQQLGRKGIFALRHAREQDVRSLAAALKIQVLPSLFNLPSIKDGIVGSGVEIAVKSIQNTVYTFISLGHESSVRTFLVGGWADIRIFQNIAAVKQALGAIRQTLKNKFVLPGAGATEIALARAIRNYINQEKGVKQHPHFKRILKEFAKALEYIPISLAENAEFERADIGLILSDIHMQPGHPDMLPAVGLNLDSLAPIKIPAEKQIFDCYYPKLVAVSLAIDTAGLLIRIDRIVKGGNLFSVMPVTQKGEERDDSQEKILEEPTHTQALHREFRPPLITDGATARANQLATQRKTDVEKKFYSKDRAVVRQRAEIFYKQHIPIDKVEQRKKMMQLAKKEKERVTKEAADD